MPLLFSVFSCNKDVASLPINGNLPLLRLSKDVKNIIPIEYRHAKYAIFRNSEGEYKSLSIKIHEYTQPKFLNGERYEAECLDFILKDSTDNSYTISIGASVIYSQKQNSYNYVDIILFSSINNGKIVLISINEDQTPSMVNAFYSYKAILGKEFRNVYEGIKFSSMDSYSDIFYTIKEGVVGFRGKENELWVLDRLE